MLKRGSKEETPTREDRENKEDMVIELDEKPVKPIIVEGFPGFGFVSTIATEFLVRHLEAKPIGRIFSRKMTPIAAIHKSEVIYPIEIFHDKKTNIVIVQAVTPVEGIEWDIAEVIVKLAEEINAKEIISLEGVATKTAKTLTEPKSAESDSNTYFYSNREEKRKSLQDIKIKPLDEGIIIGVSGALLMKSKNIPFSCFFVETHTNLPDNKGAAKLIEILDKYLGLNIDSKPLLEKAKQVEGKLKGLLTKLAQTQTQQQQKQIGYTG